MKTQSTVVTQHGQVYMKKLCRHWAHRCDVEVTDTSALIQLPFGPCQIDVDDESMKIEAQVSKQWPVAKVEKFIASHLIRMANRDEPEVNWQRNESPATA